MAGKVAFVRHQCSIVLMTRVAAALLALLFVTGCVTHKVDWQALVGHYTRDQAITDLGPPDKTAKLTDGTVVDEWLTQSGRIIIAPEPYFLPPGSYFGPATPVYTETYVPAKILRLTFGPDGRLKAWKTFAK
jgi:hypothetical protein